MTETLTDVTELVETAYEHLECISEAEEVPCGGNPAAFMSFHGCGEGYFCEAHFRFHVDVSRGRLRGDIGRLGFVRCADCRQVFSSIERFVKVYPL